MVAPKKQKSNPNKKSVQSSTKSSTHHHSHTPQPYIVTEFPMPLETCVEYYVEEEDEREEEHKTSSSKLTHFICFPMEDDSFVNQYKENVKKFCDVESEYNNKNVNDLFSPEKKLHLTVITLSLGGRNDIDIVDKIFKDLKNIVPQMKGRYKNIIFTHDKYESFEDRKGCKVIFSKMKEDSNFSIVCKIINYIIDALITKGIINQNQLKAKRIIYKGGMYYLDQLHATIMNTSFRHSRNKDFRINSQYIHDLNTHYPLQTCILNKIRLCEMGMRGRDKDEYYKVIEENI